MGQISILTKEQKIILDGINKNGFISENFYLTGGTTLSEYYLKHRYSEDLDFFSEKAFDTQHIFSFIEDLGKKYHFNFKSEAIAKVQMFFLKFPNKVELKLDFNYYPYHRLEKSINVRGLSIDSLLDIATNKLLTINQRTDIKDFVDFYYIEPKFGIWDLIEGVKIKFRYELEPWALSSDLLKVEDFDYLPKMIKPLKLADLKKFYRSLAKKVSARVIES